MHICMHIRVHICFILLCIYVYICMYTCIYTYIYISSQKEIVNWCPPVIVQPHAPGGIRSPGTCRRSFGCRAFGIVFRCFQTVPLAECVGPTGAAAAAGGSRFFFLAIDGWLYEIYWFNKSMGFHGKTCFFQWPPYFVETFFCCVTRYFWKPNSWKLGTRWFWFGAVWQLTHYPRILKRYGTPYALQHKIR